MSDEWQKYVKDPRKACKYGARCYQKNPDHHKTYKHPPKFVKKGLTPKHGKKRFEPYARIPNKSPVSTESIENKTDVEVISTVTSNEHAASTSTTVAANELQVNGRSINSFKLPENLKYYDRDTDPKILEELFLVKMPPDFFKFYDCLTEDGQSAESVLSSVNLQLIGPYDLMLGKLPVLEDKHLYLIHWRFYYDPPEFQAVLKKKGKSQFHIGYYRDNPDDAPVFLACCDSDKDCQLKPVADNIFAAVYLYLQNEKNQSPFTAVPCQKLMDRIKKWADKYNIPLSEFHMKKRLSQIVTKTFHGAGIVVPYEKKTQMGYRPLVESDANIKKLFSRLEAAPSQDVKDKILSELQPVITYGSIAVDECDFGTGLELGINLFCSGLKELEPPALSSLTATYSLLNREAFNKIIQAHLKCRRKGSDLSVTSL